MDFSVIFQLRTKKFWWMDVISYFVISLLIAAVFCYIIFLIKNNFQRAEIKKETAALETVGTPQQKEYEKEVVSYENKIGDFTILFKNHEFASNVLAFMQIQTMPNIWFKQFSLDEKNNAVQLSGESENMDALSRQVAVFEKNKYIKSVGSLSSSLGDSARVSFNLNLALDQNIFSYLSDMAGVLNPTPAPALPEEKLIQQEQEILADNTVVAELPETINKASKPKFSILIEIILIIMIIAAAAVIIFFAWKRMKKQKINTYVNI